MRSWPNLHPDRAYTGLFVALGIRSLLKELVFLEQVSSKMCIEEVKIKASNHFICFKIVLLLYCNFLSLVSTATDKGQVARNKGPSCPVLQTPHLFM